MTKSELLTAAIANMSDEQKVVQLQHTETTRSSTDNIIKK